MNRLIIIGNGFDLAHSLKTSFKDFIEDYLQNAILRFREFDIYNDQLLNLEQKVDNVPNPLKCASSPTLDNVWQTFELLKREQIVNIKSKLLERVTERLNNLKWVDLEMEFFRLLVEIKSHPQCITESRKLNMRFELLKKHMINYLSRQQTKFVNDHNKEELISCFTEELKIDEIVTVRLDKNIRPKNLYFLNFNYTNTIESYIDEISMSIPAKINYIHGSLDSYHGEPIFGFGDEMDKDYLGFEDERNNELFKHIKSFGYLMTNNYYEMMRFLETDQFQIHIYGHSCGVSDRTLLNQIFEHANCMSIKIFYHSQDGVSNDFVDKTYEISRHFKDKNELRKKLVPFQLSREMPQFAR